MTPTTRATARRAEPTTIQNDFSDYGSDVDEDALDDLLSIAESQAFNPPLVLESIEEYNSLPQAVHIPRTSASPPPPVWQRPKRVFVDENGVPWEALGGDGPIREPSVEVEYAESNRHRFSPSKHRTSAVRSPSRLSREPSVTVAQEDRDGYHDKTPLERFRTKPKKPMSVTDLVSPAWCELQYWYHLTKYGKVRATPAMKQGSSVHKVLEEQVHKTVEVDLVTKEDKFALRIWNIIQGLRILRDTGMTREFEVWAEIEGQVVNGVIDELSYACPDPELEQSLDQKRNKGIKKEKPLPADQKTMTDFFANRGASTIEGSSQATVPGHNKRVYVTDVKTRNSKSIPNSEASLRGTYYQISLYHRMLSLLASNSVPADRVFERYNVDPKATLSDSFIAQMSNLGQTPSSSADSDSTSAPSGSNQDVLDELLAHNTLERLWSLMQHDFSLSIPMTDNYSSMGDVLRAEFRTPGDGAVIGAKTFAFDDKKLDLYVKDEMGWWKGQRATKGVDIEEAFKCRICEFAEICTWRIDKVEQGLAKAKLRQEARRKSEV
ncbi:hypothetical protein MBLNU457_2343t2 [Dothideomycetes sp. NU457]